MSNKNNDKNNDNKIDKNINTQVEEQVESTSNINSGKSIDSLNLNKTEYFKWGLTAFIVIVAVMLVYFVFAHSEVLVSGCGKMARIMMPVIDGFIIAYLLSPIINKIENKIYKKKEYPSKSKKRIRVLNIIFVLILFMFIIYELFALILPEITSNLLSIKDNSSEYVKNLDNLVNDFYMKNPELGKYIDDAWNEYSDRVYDWVNSNFVPRLSEFLVSLTSGILSAVKALLNFIIGIIISIYFMYNKEIFVAQFKKVIYALFKTDFANAFIHNARFTNKTFNGFIVGKVVDSIIIGLICYIVTSLIGTPYPLLISIIIGVTNIIPFFGPFIGAIPSAFLILLIEPIQCVYFIIFVIILQQFDGNILGPKILGKSTGLSGFWVIFAITLFGGIWGILGMVVGVPLFAVIYAWISAYIKTKLELKGLSGITLRYKDVDYIDENKKFITIPDEHVVGVVSKEKIMKISDEVVRGNKK